MEDFQCWQKDLSISHKYNYTSLPKFILEGIAKTIGKPYKYSCFDLSGFDCYTLVYYLYSLIDIKLPKENINKYNLKVHQNIIDEKLILFDSISYNDRLPFDILLFESRNNINAHLGMVLDVFHYIHIMKDSTVQIVKFNNNPETADIRKIYRWKPLL